MLVREPIKSIEDRRKEVERRRNLWTALGTCFMILCGLITFLVKYDLYIRLILQK